MRQLSFKHVKSPVGVLKIIHVIFGGISFALVFWSYIPVLKLKLFLWTVAICLGISSAYLVVHVIWDDFLSQSKINKTFNLVFHVLAAMALIVCGIDLDGWSEYDITCEQECPDIYVIGVSKILTFINGTLYGIAGILEAKKDESSDEYSEVLPLKFVPSNHCRYDGHISTSSVISVNSNY